MLSSWNSSDVSSHVDFWFAKCQTWESIASDLKLILPDLYFGPTEKRLEHFLTIDDTTVERVRIKKGDLCAYRQKEDVVFMRDIVSCDEKKRLTKKHVFPVSTADQLGRVSKWLIAYNRPSVGKTAFLWPLNYHLLEAKKGLEDSQPFKEKTSKIIFRGALSSSILSHGTATAWKASRFEFCLRWKYVHTNIDLFLSSIPVETSSREYHTFKKYKTQIIGCVDSPIPIKSLIRNKYVLCLEGADISSSFGWVLASNCVPICPYPFNHEVWFFDNLMAGVHFIPCRPDGENLADVYDWCEKNPEECERIARNGRNHMLKYIADPEFILACKKEFVSRWDLKREHFLSSP